jgi:polysaccharide pyruvyl transferase WcaK-like protein
MKKIFLGGCPFGDENLGDDAILSSLLNTFGSRKDELTICKIDYINNGYIDEYVNIKRLNTKIYTNKFYSPPIFGFSINGRRNPIKAFFNYQLDKRQIKSKDLLICGGGTLITDLPWQIIKLINVSKKLNVPTILFGMGMAEIKDYNSIKFLQKTLNQLEDIYVRDLFVKSKLLAIGINEEKIKVCYDPAIALIPNAKFNINSLFEKNEIALHENDRIKIAISLSSESDIKKETDFNAINTIIKYLINKYNAIIFLIPTSHYKNCDTLFMSKLSINSNVILIKKRFEPEDLIQFLSKFHLVLSSRLHLNIFSSIVGTPFIGLIRNSKISDYSTIHQLNSYYFNEIDSMAFYTYLDFMIENNKSIRKKILNNIEIMRSIHIDCVEEIFKKYLA